MSKLSIYDPIENEEQDILERRFLAERIFKRLADENCPQVIGIYGGWGTGKTSLLNLIQEKWKLSGTKDLHLEYVDAWHYEGSGTLFVPVIVRMMAKRAAFNPDWSEYFKRVSFAALYMGTDIALRTLAAGVKIDDIKKYENDMEQSGLTSVSLLDWEKITDKVEETQSAFRKLIHGVNEKTETKQIIFLIDNLDRCSPENAVSLLESIKNFLMIPGCIWIFAMDADVIASYIGRKYQDTAMDGNSYLDKIIPEQYHLSFFPADNDRRVFDLIFNATNGFVTLNDERRLPQLPRIVVPRRLKKSAGKFAEYFDSKLPDADRDTVFLLSLLYHTWPEFYARLSSPSIQHIGGILANFFKNRKTEDMGMQWGEYSPSPLDKKFTEDQDLIYFLRTAFPKYNTGTEIVKEIHRALSGLRGLGLP